MSSPRPHTMQSRHTSDHSQGRQTLPKLFLSRPDNSAPPGESHHRLPALLVPAVGRPRNRIPGVFEFPPFVSWTNRLLDRLGSGRLVRTRSWPKFSFARATGLYRGQ
ncbi:hypothetical protein PoB_001541800 [Plakobranchus ocellatus]|uniref:Uncharacterized protein n=1 Tax=Plakobranchus ocellatus TaxID=259542 RepID=A0AAV3Z365_9GAST|nr:hypothetical protein PoB_001541800 [Plakobranchus ocellatus]